MRQFSDPPGPVGAVRNGSHLGEYSKTAPRQFKERTRLSSRNSLYIERKEAQ